MNSNSRQYFRDTTSNKTAVTDDTMEEPMRATTAIANYQY